MAVIRKSNRTSVHDTFSDFKIQRNTQFATNMWAVGNRTEYQANQY